MNDNFTHRVYILVGVGKHYCENCGVAFNAKDARAKLDAAQNSDYDGFAWYKMEVWDSSGRMAVCLKPEQVL